MDKEILEAVQLQSEARGVGHDHLGGEEREGDLIQAYKVLHGKERVSFQTWFQMCAALEDRRGTRAREGMFNVERLEGRLELRKNFWSVRVADKWNQLPDLVKSANTVNSFKNGLDNWTEKEKKRRAAAYLGGP